MTEPTTIALVRHGQTDWNAEHRYQGSSSDTVLNDLGRSQALEAATSLRRFSENWDLVRHSPMRRATETAQIIADELGVTTMAPLASLTERDWGFGEGHTHAEMIELFPELGQYASEGEANEYYLGAEPLDLVVDRGVFALATMAAQYPGRSVVAATHGTLLRSTALLMWIRQCLFAGGFEQECGNTEKPLAEHPEYAHLPLIDNAAGRRLAKRERSLDMGALRARNVTPEQIIGYCAWLLRLQPTPIPCKPADLLADFSWEPLRANHLDRALKPDDPTTPQWLAEALG